jgi:hypothetical protein
MCGDIPLSFASDAKEARESLGRGKELQGGCDYDREKDSGSAFHGLQ